MQGLDSGEEPETLYVVRIDISGTSNSRGVAHGLEPRAD